MAVRVLSALRSGRWQAKVGRGTLHLALIGAGITFLLPLAWVLSASLKRRGDVFQVPIQWIPSSPQWQNYALVFTKLPFLIFIRNTGVLAILQVTGGVLSSLLVAYSLARLRWPGRDVVFVVLLATMMLPGVVLLIPTFVMFKYVGWLDTLYPLFVPAWFGNAFYTFLLRQFIMGIPFELDEAARIDGAGSLRILLQVIVPVSKPALATVAIFALLAAYNDFMGPLLYLRSLDKFTISLGLYLFSGKWGDFAQLVMSASVITLTPMIVLFFAAQRYFVQGIQFTGLAGR